MIRRLIAYLYLGDYDPCNELAIASFSNIRQHNSTTAAASACHRRNGAPGNSGSFDPCACLEPNISNIEQPVSETQYTGVFTFEKPRNTVEVNEPLTIHATMYALADKYHVNGLAEVAKVKFEACLRHHVDSEDFVSAVQLTYSSTPESNRGLRDAVVNAFLVHFQVKITEVPGLEAKLDTIDELSFLLMKSWPHKTEKSKPIFGSAAASIKPTSNLFGAPAAPAVPSSGTGSRLTFGATLGTNSAAPPVAAASGNRTWASSVLGAPSTGTQATPGTASPFANFPPRASNASPFGQLAGQTSGFGSAR
jgi:hypothetical protein